MIEKLGCLGGDPSKSPCPGWGSFHVSHQESSHQSETPCVEFDWLMYHPSEIDVLCIYNCPKNVVNCLGTVDVVSRG